MEKLSQWIKYDRTYRLNASLSHVCRFYFSAVLNYRVFIWANFLKYFKATHRQSYFQLLWKILLPLIPVSVYLVMQLLGFLKSSKEMPAALFVIIGMTFWQLFSSSLSLTMNAPDKERALLKKVNLPFLLFYISSLGEVIFDYLIRLFLIWALLIYYKVPFSFNWILLPFFLIPFLLFGAGLGIFLSFFSIFYKDVKNLAELFLRYGLFASGVLFPITGEGEWVSILQMNPLLILIDNFRSLLVFSSFSNTNHLSLTSAFIVLFILYTFKKLYSLEPRLREFL